jgi:hypothetical protein
MTMETADIKEPIPFERLIKGDDRHDAYEGRVTTDTIQRELVLMKLSPRLPPTVTHLLGLSKQLCVAGFFFYDLYSVAIHHAAVASEVAMRERFVGSLPDPLIVSKGGQQWTLGRPSSDRVVEILREGWRLPGQQKNFVAGFRQLVKWAETQRFVTGDDVGWWEATQQLRNMYAHGSDAIVPVNFPISVLRRTVWMVNALFPDPDTVAYDRPLREAADAAVAREDEELHRMFQEGREA